MPQSNSVTHQLDNSNIYGSTDEALRSVRPPPASDTGELLNTPAGDLLPQTVGCKPPGCYFTGDLRGAFYPTLTLLHTAMMRLHNRHARALRAVNAHWGAERVFQEARRLTTAVYQHVTYNEWARTVLGDRAVAVGNVSTAVAGADGQSAYSGWYDAEVDGSTMDDHTTGAARSMHQHTPERMRLYDESMSALDYPIPIDYIIIRRAVNLINLMRYRRLCPDRRYCIGRLPEIRSGAAGD